MKPIQESAPVTARRPAPGERPLLVSLQQATLGYGRQAVLRDVALDLREGDFLGIVGPNGAGKSTLLKTMLRLLPPISGTVRVDAEQGRLQFGYVPQRDTVATVFPLEVREIVAMGRFGRVGLVRRLRRADWEAVERALERVGIADLGRRDYGELSGGQRQRALIARALAAEPDILFLDEPTNGMDLSSEHTLLELVRNLHDQFGLTVVMVTHLLSNVANYAGRIAIIAGEHLEVGSSAEMLTEARLEQLYGLRVQVGNIGSRIAIVPANGLPSEVRNEPR
jgi:ABC-type Mn2+/Zn2+ transport system ATPase subunit